MLAKLIPMVTLVSGAAMSSPKVKAEFAKLLQTTEVMATQHEVSDIAKMVYLDTIDGTQPKPEEFSQYIQARLRAPKGITRDTSVDQWGQAYRLTYNHRRHELVVSSAGPDSEYDTADDIRASYSIDRQL